VEKFAFFILPFYTEKGSTRKDSIIKLITTLLWQTQTTTTAAATEDSQQWMRMSRRKSLERVEKLLTGAGMRMNSPRKKLEKQEAKAERHEANLKAADSREAAGNMMIYAHD
jgi:hypothetical protein